MSEDITLSHILDTTYDEDMDPDFTTTNMTTILSENDEDDEEDFDDDFDEQEIIDLTENGSETDISSSPSVEEKPTEKGSTNSDSTLNIHNRFYSFIHKHEIPRKLLHVSIGFITLYFHVNGYKTSAFWPNVLRACVIIISLDILRFNWMYFNKLYCQAVGFLMRDSEIDSVNGVIWFQIGLILTFMFQKQDVAVMSILLLSWSDTAASTVGRKFGKYSPKLSRGKSLIGSFAAFLTGVLACYLFYGYITPKYPEYSQFFEYNEQNNYLNIHTLALLSGFIASISEGIDVFNLDDNLTIPLFSGVFLSAVIKLGKME